jgi:hypothetical protein
MARIGDGRRSQQAGTSNGKPVKYEDSGKHLRSSGTLATCRMEAEVEVRSIGFSWTSDPLDAS